MTTSQPPRELSALCSIALQAGREIMQVYDAGAAGSISKDDGSPLTEADLRADAVIRAGLEREFPGVAILSEESGSGPRDAGQDFFLVDPLDGTKEFLQRNGEFTVNIALVRQGAPVMGVVFAPALGELFQGAKGHGAWKGAAGQERAIAVRPHDSGSALRVMGSRSHGTDAMGRWLDALGAAHEFVAAGSSLKFCRIAEGLADVYPRMGPTSQWDTAAGQAVLEAAGGVVLDASGAPLRYGPQRPILNPFFIAVGRVQTTLPPIG